MKRHVLSGLAALACLYLGYSIVNFHIHAMNRTEARNVSQNRESSFELQQAAARYGRQEEAYLNSRQFLNPFAQGPRKPYDYISTPRLMSAE